jgi:ribonuclease P protein component
MEAPVRHTFSRHERLKRSSDFRRCIKQGGRAVGESIVVYAAPNERGVTRLGAGSTRRLGTAVERNRAKRLVREAFRLTKAELPTGIDLVVLPKIPWREPSVEALCIDLVATVGRAAPDRDETDQGD